MRVFEDADSIRKWARECDVGATILIIGNVNAVRARVEKLRGRMRVQTRERLRFKFATSPGHAGQTLCTRVPTD